MEIVLVWGGRGESVGSHETPGLSDMWSAGVASRPAFRGLCGPVSAAGSLGVVRPSV